jgi:hypothetical protein
MPYKKPGPKKKLVLKEMIVSEVTTRLSARTPQRAATRKHVTGSKENPPSTMVGTASVASLGMLCLTNHLLLTTLAGDTMPTVTVSMEGH